MEDRGGWGTVNGVKDKMILSAEEYLQTLNFPWKEFFVPL